MKQESKLHDWHEGIEICPVNDRVRWELNAMVRCSLYNLFGYEEALSEIPAIDLFGDGRLFVPNATAAIRSIVSSELEDLMAADSLFSHCCYLSDERKSTLKISIKPSPEISRYLMHHGKEDIATTGFIIGGFPREWFSFSA